MEEFKRLTLAPSMKLRPFINLLIRFEAIIPIMTQRLSVIMSSITDKPVFFFPIKIKLSSISWYVIYFLLSILLRICKLRLIGFIVIVLQIEIPVAKPFAINR